MNNVQPIFDFLKQQMDQGQATALVTLTAVTGASTRNPGAHMAAAADGRFVGSFSGGCVEAAVVAEALDAITAGRPREVRFGEGSPYLDIKLPCGGGIDLLIQPIETAQVIADIHSNIVERRPFTITMDRVTGAMTCQPGSQAKPISRDGDKLLVNHVPAAKVAILGHGASVEHLAQLTASYGITYQVFTPDQITVDAIAALGGDVIRLKTPTSSKSFQPDPWTACVFLFHDHDWEARLMQQALASPAFYVGAMGSYKTHDHRKQLLDDIGVSADDIAKMIAPIGLIPSTRDPATLALSTLGQIVEHYHDHFDRHRPHRSVTPT